MWHIFRFTYKMSNFVDILQRIINKTNNKKLWQKL